MDGNSVITVISIFIAVYSIMPADRRADIAIRLVHGISSSIGAILLLATLYFLYWDFLNAQGFHNSRYAIPFSVGFNAKYALLSIALVILLGTAILISLPSKFYIGHVPKWIKHSKILLEEQNLDELSKLLSKYCDNQIGIITSEKYLLPRDEKLKQQLKENLVYLLNDIDFTKHLSEHKPRVVNSLIQSGLSDDLIQTFLAVQISSPQSMFFKGSHEDAIWKNPDAYSFMRSVCEHSTFSNTSPAYGAKETLIKILTTSEIINNINLPLSHHDDPHDDCWLHPIRLSTNLYKICYENSLENDNNNYTPNAYDLAQIGVRIIEHHAKSPNRDRNFSFQSKSEYLIWNIENTYTGLIKNNESNNMELSTSLYSAYGYLVREILLNENVRSSRKLKSLVQFVNVLQFIKAEDKKIKNLLLKEHQGATESEEVRSIILDLHRHHEELLPHPDSKDIMTLNMIPTLFSKDN